MINTCLTATRILCSQLPYIIHRHQSLLPYIIHLCKSFTYFLPWWPWVKVKIIQYCAEQLSCILHIGLQNLTEVSSHTQVDRKILTLKWQDIQSALLQHQFLFENVKDTESCIKIIRGQWSFKNSRYERNQLKSVKDTESCIKIIRGQWSFKNSRYERNQLKSVHINHHVKS